MKIESSKLIRRAQSTRIYLWLPHTQTHACSSCCKMALKCNYFMLLPHAHVSGKRDLCVCVYVLYLNLIARLAAQICQEQTGDSKRKWKDEGPVTVGSSSSKHCDTSSSSTHCTLHCCTAATVALTVTATALCCQPQKSVSQAKSASERCCFSFCSQPLVLFCLSCVLATAETHSTFGKRF